MTDPQRASTEAFELTLLQRLSDTLHDPLASPFDVLDRALRDLAHTCRADHVVLATLQGDTRVRLDVAVGLSAEQVKRAGCRVGEGVLGRVIQSAQAIAAESERVSREDCRGGWPLADSPINRYLCVPIVSRALGVIGALGIDRCRPDASWVHDDLRLLTVVAALLADRVHALRAVVEEHEAHATEAYRWSTLTRGLRSSAILGESASIQHMLGLINQVAASDSPVLVIGEDGAGKELVAKEIHARSGRRDKPFVSVSCESLRGPIADAELFGHIRGAMGSSSGRRGHFGVADGGTLFFDDVHLLPLPLQGRLALVLRDRASTRVGEDHAQPIDVRLVAATHVDLAREVANGLVREDLYYLLTTFPISVPPLRARKDDIPLLARHLCDAWARMHQRPARHLGPSALAALSRHDWPGNVRELETVLLRAVLLAPGTQIEAQDLPATVRQSDHATRPLEQTLEDRLLTFEREAIQRALDAAGGNRLLAARALQTTPRILANRLRRLNQIEASNDGSTPNTLRRALDRIA